MNFLLQGTASNDLMRKEGIPTIGPKTESKILQDCQTYDIAEILFSASLYGLHSFCYYHNKSIATNCKRIRDFSNYGFSDNSLCHRVVHPE
jgi:hypothetical protein